MSQNHWKFCGQPVAESSISLIIETLELFPSLSRSECAATMCELLGWQRPNGKLKVRECHEFLQLLDYHEIIQLPKAKGGRPPRSTTKIERQPQCDEQAPITGNVQDFKTLQLKRVEGLVQRKLWMDYIDRYHYLGFKTPFGAHLRYFITGQNDSLTLGCLQFSSPALKVQVRDEWIGWTSQKRKKNLPFIVQNSRFLIFPWVKIRNLASSVLSLANSMITMDWEHAYGIQPVLLETFIDQNRFKGTCYKASNWTCLGPTKGRGRMDARHDHLSTLKTVWVNPLHKQWRSVLIDKVSSVQ